MKRIGVLTGGGDAPGMNPALKAVVYRASEAGIATVGIFDGWEGLLGADVPEVLDLEKSAVRTWDRDAGTHLGASRTNPFRVLRGGSKCDASAEVARNVERLRLDALVLVGGSDALGVAQRMGQAGIPIVAIPKSINKQVAATDYALGFDSSLRICADIIERSRTPAGSKRWVQVVEVFGHRSGHLALWSGLAGGAQVILIPEHPFRLEKLYELIDDRLHAPAARGTRTRALRHGRGRREGASAGLGGHEITVDTATDDFGHLRVGGIGALLAERIRSDTENDARAVALGHPQRGGERLPPVDRIMGHLFGSAAIEACIARRFGTMVAAHGVVPMCSISLVSIAEAIATRSAVDIARYYDTDRYFARRSVLTG